MRTSPSLFYSRPGECFESIVTFEDLYALEAYQLKVSASGNCGIRVLEARRVSEGVFRWATER
jgi:hypothetical protein